jgi:hypothetical protein
MEVDPSFLRPVSEINLYRIYDCLPFDGSHASTPFGGLPLLTVAGHNMRAESKGRASL